jgi:TetR/AcrR family transcriptional regulator
MAVKHDDGKTKERILKAAIEEFIKCGFDGARTQAIADRAKVNKAMLHYYYANKENMYEQAINTVANAIIDKLGKIPAEQPQIEDRIGSVMDAYIEIFTDYADYFKIVIYEAMRGGKVLKKVLLSKNILNNSSIRSFIKYFDNQVSAGKVRKVDKVQLFMSIVTQMLPVFIAGQILNEIVDVFGVKKVIAEKFIKGRKKFVLDLIMNGIRIRREQK